MAGNRTSKQCACRHTDDNGAPTPGSGSANDPYMHESPKFVCVKTANGTTNLTINENGCVILPRSVRRVVQASDGTTLLPNAQGHIIWSDFISSFSIAATNYPDTSFARNVTEFTPTNDTMVLTQYGAQGSTVENNDGDVAGTVQQNSIYTPGGASSEVSFPQLRTETTRINEITYPLAGISPDFDTRVDLWQTNRTLAIGRATTAIAHVSFTLSVDPNPGSISGQFEFDILDASGTVMHQGYWEPEFPIFRTYAYFFPVSFAAPNVSSGNSQIEWRISQFSGLPNTSSVIISDIMAAYTLM